MQSRDKIAYLGALSLLMSLAELFVPRPLPFFRLGLANIPLLLGDRHDGAGVHLLQLLSECGKLLLPLQKAQAEVLPPQFIGQVQLDLLQRPPDLLGGVAHLAQQNVLPDLGQVGLVLHRYALPQQFHGGEIGR